MELQKNYVNLIGINESGKSVLDSITPDNLEWFLRRAVITDKIYKKTDDECSITIKRIFNHSINKYYASNINNIDFNTKMGEKDYAIMILVYDVLDCELAFELEKKLSGDNIFFINICINEGCDLYLEKCINTTKNNAREVVFNMIMLALPCPGLICYGLEDFLSFIEEGYKYNSFIVRDKTSNDVVKEAIYELDKIDKKYEKMMMILGKGSIIFETKEIIDVRDKYNITGSNYFSDSTFKDFLVFVLYKIKSDEKIVN